MAQSSGSRINTNISALNALNALNTVQKQLGVAQLRLASGKRINSASDDAAGYVISKKMDSRIRTLNAALDNAGDAQSVLSVAEGGYATVSDLLNQIKEKQARFMNGGLGTDEQNAIANEVSQLATEIDDTVAQTKFNGKVLLDGSFVAGVSQSAASSGIVAGLAAGGATITSVDVSAAKANTSYQLSASGATLTLTRLSDNAAQTVTVGAETAGTAQALNFTSLGVTINLMGTATSSATTVAAGLVTAATMIGTTAGTSAAFQVGDTGENFSMSFSGVSATGLLGVAAGSITASNLQSLTVDTALSTVLSYIGNIGAKMNRLDEKQSNLTTAITNTQAAQSRIQDADIANEQISAVKLQVLQQTATAQLAQANQTPQVFLSLFK